MRSPYQVFFDVLMVAEKAKDRGFQVQLAEDGVTLSVTIRLPVTLLHDARTPGGDRLYDVMKGQLG